MSSVIDQETKFGASKAEDNGENAGKFFQFTLLQDSFSATKRDGSKIRKFFKRAKGNFLEISMLAIILLIFVVLLLVGSLISSVGRMSRQVNSLEEYSTGLDTILEEELNTKLEKIRVSRNSSQNFNKTLWETAGSCSRLQKSRNLTKAQSKSASSMVHRIYPPSSGPSGIDILCDFHTEGGGWSIIQRRGRGSKWGFYRGWTDYEQGFGSLDENSDFWIGLKTIHDLTSQSSGVANQELRIELTDWDGNSAFAQYEHFAVSNSSDQYRLSIGGFLSSSTAGNSMLRANGMQFSTKDRDNDKFGENCAAVYFGAWWFNSCFDGDLNGLLWPETEAKFTFGKDGISWHSWKDPAYSLRTVEMKIRDVQ